MLYHFYEPIIRPLLEITGTKSIVEIGTEEGRHTRKLLGYCKEQGAVLHAIDIFPVLDLPRWQEEYGAALVFHQGKSLDILPTIEHYDAVLIDGDHNWYTAYHELLAIGERSKAMGAFPLVFLHDVGWPFGRRDIYYNPEEIPAEFRQPYERKGVLPDREMLATKEEGAFCSEYCLASREGGPRNGILTAVEDFLSQSNIAIRSIIIPGMHGLGVLVEERRIEANPELRPFLTMIERNPLRSLVEVLEMERLSSQVGHRSQDLRRKHLERLLWRREATIRAELAKNMWKRGEEAGPLLERVYELEEAVRCISRTKSWRWTMPLRLVEGMLRGKHSIKRASAQSPDCHTEPCRSATIQHVPWFDRAHHDRTPNTAPQPPIPNNPSDIAVIIPCHNYGRYLREAIESVLTQTLPPWEIIVVDDASEDDTAFIARRYEGKGVHYTYGAWKSVAAARNEGARLTTSPYLVFLDADDFLPPHYLAACKEAITSDSSVAIAYGDALHCEDESAYCRAPDFDRERLMRENYISACAMIRRQAFDMAGGYRECHGTHQDWDLYRRIISFAWRAQRAETYFSYRHHAGSMRWKSRRSDRWGYCKRAMLMQHPVTIFTPFAGRKEFLPEFIEALRCINFDPMLLRIHWHDTSGDEVFGKMLRQALAEFPFERTTYTAAPLPPSWRHTPTSLIEKRPKHEDDAAYYTQLVVSRAYNSLLMTCDTELALTLEDDILIAPDTLTKLLEVVEEETVAVLAPYLSRFDERTTVRELDAHDREIPIAGFRSGVEEVAGGGFGCTLFRMSALHGEPIYATGDCTGMWYDHRVFRRLRQKGKVLCQWDALVEHRGSLTPFPSKREREQLAPASV